MKYKYKYKIGDIIKLKDTVIKPNRFIVIARQMNQHFKQPLYAVQKETFRLYTYFVLESGIECKR